VSDQEFKRAFGYATLAMDLLKRALVPPYPQFYELLYTYATGVNPALNARINAIFRDGRPTVRMAEALYAEFLKAQDVNERISNVSERMSARMTEVHDAIDTAMVSAHAFSGSLQEARGNLEGEMTIEDLRHMAAGLLEKTRSMQETNSHLKHRLEASRADIASLQRDLDEVRRESMLDPLTKIYNRKSFDEGLVRCIGEASEGGQPLSLLLVDIDHFKMFNDSYGHQTGDQVLRLVAMTLKSNVKGKDIVARYGGEEFAAILPSTDLEGAMRLADNIRKAIQAKELLKRSTHEKLGRITASFGVAVYRPGEAPAMLIERADRCLYAAKRAGRNRVFGEVDLAPEDDSEAA
jgi:diguanylate cyclase